MTTELPDGGNDRQFGSTEDVAITILVDNRADLIASSTGAIKAFTDQPLLAEHGFAALVELRKPGVRILWDGGMSDIALPHNMRQMRIDPTSIDIVALSHGHSDHTAALSAVLRAMSLQARPRNWPARTPLGEMGAYAQGRRVPIVAHSAVFRERWSQKKRGGWYGPLHTAPRAEWGALGADMVLVTGPYQLAPGCWTTGTVPRRSFETSGIPKRIYYRDGDQLIEDYAEDDQSIVIHVQGKGLIILSGCAHSGIVNTVNYARQISGVERVHSVIGGYHLARADTDEVDQTVEAFRDFAPALVVPTHCTGFGPTARFSLEFISEFDACAVGKTYLF